MLLPNSQSRSIAGLIICLLEVFCNAFPTRNDELSQQYSLLKGAAGQHVESTAGCYWCKSSLYLKGKSAAKYAVGTQIPTLPFKTKNSWAGLLPVNAAGDESFYFYLWGKDAPTPGNDLVIFLSGGPGCSSLAGMIQEIGPFLHTDKTKAPYANPYSWTKSANLLFVEMPLGVGFTQGPMNTLDEEELATQFDTFLYNFFKTFPELHGKRVFLAAESYAGIYFSYLLNRLYSTGNKYNVKGGMVISGYFSSRYAQSDLVANKFAIDWANALNLTPEDLMTIKKQSDQCKYTTYLEENLHYPPKGRLPDFDHSGCNVTNTFASLANKHHPDLNPYRISRAAEPEIDPLGFSYTGIQGPTWFDNVELQNYIHAPIKKWNICQKGVFPYGDKSGPPNQTPSFNHSILASVIERSSAGVVMLSGREDAILMTDGTSLLLQNLTWGQKQGFSKPPTQTLIDIDGRPTGTFISERGLTYAIVEDSGHMVPFDAQGTGLAALEVMLGRRSFAG